MTPMSSRWQKGKISSSTSRRIKEYGGWSEVIGAMLCATCICSTLKLETPIQRTFPSCQGAGDDFFRVASAIDGRGINPVDAQFQGAMNCRDGRVVILSAPGELPAGSANGPGPEAHRRNE